MGVFNYEAETTSVIPAARLFKAFILDGNNLVPKVSPQAVSRVENVEGNGGPGTIKKITFPEGGPVKYVKERVEEVDHTNFKYSYTVIEGGPVGDKVEKICNEIMIVAAPDGGSILKITSKFHTKGDHEVPAEHIKGGKERVEGLLKPVEAYLLAHTAEYNN